MAGHALMPSDSALHANVLLACHTPVLSNVVLDSSLPGTVRGGTLLVIITQSTVNISLPLPI